MGIAATGRVEQSASGPVIVIERTFRTLVAEVWHSIVDPERMNRWIGTWTGEPCEGKRVQFVTTAEGSTEPEEVLIHRCDPPSHLDVESFQAGASWRLAVDLAETDGVTNAGLPAARGPRRGEREQLRPRVGVLPGSSRCRAGGH